MFPLGPVAHLVECRHGMAEVTGSIPVGSTIHQSQVEAHFYAPAFLPEPAGHGCTWWFRWTGERGPSKLFIAELESSSAHEDMIVRGSDGVSLGQVEHSCLEGK
jgi:hypothetical protein